MGINKKQWLLLYLFNRGLHIKKTITRSSEEMKKLLIFILAMAVAFIFATEAYADLIVGN